MKWLLLLVGFLVYEETSAFSLRKIFTLFTDEKTWNEASAICESQFGQLAKIEDDGDLHEINQLDKTKWSNRVKNTSLTWVGLHLPFINTTWEYQDCEVLSPSVTVFGSSGDRCAAMNTQNEIRQTDCSMKNIFICERYEGDCWFDPHIQQTFDIVPDHVITLSPVTLVASDCAMQCRNQTYLGNECWAFLYDIEHTVACELYFLDVTNASVVYTDATPVFDETSPDYVFYVRRCFEGEVDTKAYHSFEDPSSEPATVCNTTVYAGDQQAMNVCFCSTEDQPTIPEPITAEEKAAKLIEELTIDSSNTSSASRKLSSAEDDRPSAVGVGLVGVGLLTAVFGGLLLMDLNVLIAGIRELMCSVQQPTSVAPSETNC